MMLHDRRGFWFFWILSVVAVLAAAEHGIQFLQRVQRPGLWKPEDYEVQQRWLQNTAQHLTAHPQELHPAVAELRDLIENNSRLYLLASGMYEHTPANCSDPNGSPFIRSYQQMLQVMSFLVTAAPPWSRRESEVGLVGLPMHALLDWPMGTYSGFSFFLDPQVNAVLKKVLNAWGDFLRSPDSAYVLNSSISGWFGPAGTRTLTSAANLDGSDYSFDEVFVCDREKKNYGFASWDDFFTRRFREGKRPVVAPGDDSVLANVCESLPYAISHDVKQRDEFWTKGQPYSIQDMLGQNELSDRFVGGTVYQAFLNQYSYHRWHAPVSGRIVKTAMFNGTYYSEPLFEISDHYGAHPESPENIQKYLSVIATRAVIYIMADNPDIGLVAVVLVGMLECSSCEIGVTEGQRVKKGDEIGMFHYGGSSWCFLTTKDSKVSGFTQPGERTENIPVRGRLAVVKRRSPADEL